MPAAEKEAQTNRVSGRRKRTSTRERRKEPQLGVDGHIRFGATDDTAAAGAALAAESSDNSGTAMAVTSAPAASVVAATTPSVAVRSRVGIAASVTAAGSRGGIVAPRDYASLPRLAGLPSVRLSVYILYIVCLYPCSLDAVYVVPCWLTFFLLCCEQSGDVLAFRHLEIGADLTPTMSDYRVRPLFVRAMPCIFLSRVV